MPNDGVQTIRITPDSSTMVKKLGLLADLAGTWFGQGFNLIARPDFAGNSDLYLQLNETHETLKIDPIGSPIPNRGFGQDDIELFGLTYLQKISDIFTGGALHIEPGFWITQPNTNYPLEQAPAEQQLIFRMGSIPHGSGLIAQGIAKPFTGTPVLKTATEEYAFSAFPSFNSTPFGAIAPGSPNAPGIISAAGSSEKLSAESLTPPVQPFPQYDLTNPQPIARTPFGTNPPDPPLPAAINGVPMQDVINDPIKLLQQVITEQLKGGYTFDGVALNIATQAQITFATTPNKNTPNQPVTVPNGAGGVENILFLDGKPLGNGQPPAGNKGPNAFTALVYATFWIERVNHPKRPTFVQLQYAQMTILDFQILHLLQQVPGFPPPPNPPVAVNLGWPHISIATLRKTFD